MILSQLYDRHNFIECLTAADEANSTLDVARIEALTMDSQDAFRLIANYTELQPKDIIIFINAIKN